MGAWDIGNRMARRMQSIKPSLIREVLRVTQDPSVISFAGGLPSPDLFAVEEMSRATTAVLRQDGRSALQCSPTSGYPPLREWIAAHCRRHYGLRVDADQILITSGSQQGLDLIGKVFVNPYDPVAIEQPGYLGAIQVLRMQEARIYSVPMLEDGLDLDLLETCLNGDAIRLLYTNPNFQNPSGLTHSLSSRRRLVERIRDRDVVVVEDDPYGLLRYEGEDLPSLASLLPDKVLLLGSFSKVVAPGLRLGWICGPAEAVERLALAKQAADLHTGTLIQRILAQYLADNDLAAHVAMLRRVYRRRRDLMLDTMERFLPAEVIWSRPQGGMFLWADLPAGVSSLTLFERALRQKVAVVPGTPFYVEGGGESNLRLNFSNASESDIETGIARLGAAMRELME
ncbi:MAG: PLP-dependent aminotransferase family protein [Phycisphaerae bacterium]|nr:PLP-dependent aminotransferase family protein [Phycisphaerae bacterium]